MKRLIFIAVGIAILLLASGSGPVPAADDVVVTQQWLADHLQDGNLVLIHVGARKPVTDGMTRVPYREGHIPGARHLPWNRLVTDRDGLTNELPRLSDLTRTMRSLGIDDTRRIVLYDTGGGLEAARAYVTLDYLGLGRRTSLLDGQWKEWVRQGRATTTATPAFAESAFVPGRTGPVFINWATLRSAIYNGEPGGVPVALFDARPMDEYGGVHAGRGVPRPGHIPYAECVPWDDALVSLDRPLFKPRGELSRLFKTFGARPGCLVITYCRTGVKASHLYVTARLLGYRARLYDGSFMEWSSIEDLPVIDGVWAE